MLRRERVEGLQANEFRSARRFGESGGLDAVAAEPTMASESSAAGEVFGSADRPTNRPTDQPTGELFEISDALQPGRWRIRHG